MSAAMCLMAASIFETVGYQRKTSIVDMPSC